MNIKNTKFTFAIIVAFASLFFLYNLVYAADSENYNLTVFDVDVAGEEGASANFDARDALNNFVTGEYDSANYEIRAGYLYFKPPNLPLAVSGELVSPTSVKWNFTDQADDESGFLVKDLGFVEQQREYGIDLSSITESGLEENTAYSRYVYAFNYFGESLPAGPISITTSIESNTGCLNGIPGLTYMDLTACEFNNDDVLQSGYFFTNNDTFDVSGWQSGDNTWTNDDLDVNTSYPWKVDYRNQSGDIVGTYTFTAYTLAETPGKPILSAYRSGNSWSITMEVNPLRNPDYTEYVVTVNGDYSDKIGGVSGTENWQTGIDWNYNNAEAGKTYTVRSKARNGDGIETEFSEPAFITITEEGYREPTRFEKIMAIFRDALNAFRNNSLVQFVNTNIIAPLLIALAAINLLTTIGTAIIPFISYLWQLFTEPFIFFIGKKRKPWGIVYNALTKKPIDLVTVRIFESLNRKLIETRITDKKGRFGFIVDPGEYYIEVVKEGYKFPSMKMKQRVEEVYDNVYLGGNIQVPKNDLVINVNIPIDPMVDKVDAADARQIVKRYLLRRFNLFMALIGPAIAVVCVWVSPTKLNWILLGIHAVVLFLFTVFTFHKPGARWGIVYNSISRNPISLSVVRIFSKKYNELLETQVTDTRGRFGFIVGPDTYKVTVEKPGFKFPSVKAFGLKDYKGDDIKVLDKEGHLVKLNIPVDPGSNTNDVNLNPSSDAKEDFKDQVKTQKESNEFLKKFLKK